MPNPSKGGNGNAGRIYMAFEITIQLISMFRKVINDHFFVGISCRKHILVVAGRNG